MNERGQGIVGLVIVLALLVVAVVVIVKVLDTQLQTIRAQIGLERDTARMRADTARAQADAERAAAEAETARAVAAAEAARVNLSRAEADLTRAETDGVEARHAVWRGDVTFVSLLFLGCVLVGGLTALCVTLLRRQARLEAQLARQLAPPYVAASLSPPADTWLPVELRQQVGAHRER